MDRKMHFKNLKEELCCVMNKRASTISMEQLKNNFNNMATLELIPDVSFSQKSSNFRVVFK